MIPENVLCEICSCRPAKLVVLRRRQDDLKRTFVCQECANERARLYTRTDLDLKRVMDKMDKRSTETSAAYSCKFCGATLADIVVDGRPGCCYCYSRFANEIEQAIETAQGRTSHVGKAPNK